MTGYGTPVKRPRTANNNPRYGVHHDKTTTTSQIRQIVKSIQQSITGVQRVEALQQLLDFIGYDPSTRVCRCHTAILSQFIEGRCIYSLTLQLGYTLHRGCLYEIPSKHSTEDLNLISIALEVFYRNCPQLVTEDYIRKDGSEVLRLLQEVLVQYRGSVDSRNANGRNPSNNFILIRPVICIWHSCSSCSLGTMLLLQNPGTLQAINNILSSEKQSYHKSIDGIEIILECLGLLKNLSYYGEDHRHLIVNKTELIATLTSLTDVPNNKARERLSAVFRNLALSADVRSQLAQRADVITAIVRMANLGIPKSEPSSYGINTVAKTENTNYKKNTLRNILSTITSLAIDTNKTHLMVFHGDGILIDQLKQFVVYSEDFVARKRAVRALRLLARDPSSAPVMVLQNNQLFEILSDRVFNDMNDSVRMEATEAFAKCSNLIQSPMNQHNYVLDELTRMLVTATAKPLTTTANLDIVARALKEQASNKVNRRSMATRRNLLQALANVILSDNTTLGAKESVCVALVHLSEETPEQEVIAIPIILDALVQTFIDQPRIRASSAAAIDASSNINTIVMNRICEFSVRTILNLAKAPSNRKDMAKQTALIQSLLRFAAATTTSEDVKKQVKGAILQLAAEL